MILSQKVGNQAFLVISWERNLQKQTAAKKTFFYHSQLWVY